MYRLYQRLVQHLENVELTGFVGDPPNAVEPPYVFVWGDYPTRFDVTLAQSVGVIDVDVNVTCVDVSPANALKLAALVETQLRGFQPQITGWFVEPLHLTGSTPLQTSRGVASAATNREPAAVVLHLRVRAAEKKEGDAVVD